MRKKHTSEGGTLERSLCVFRLETTKEATATTQEGGGCNPHPWLWTGGYLVDPASGICLSQGLSHASVSISEFYDETANGSVKQL